MRGEHHWLARKMHHTQGSSPHARGALDDQPVFKRTRRIIPACAGSTYEHTPERPQLGDHPRMRGEHRLKVSVISPVMGSSPHARGAPHLGTACVGDFGIIPACAGSTGGWRRNMGDFWDHPRMRGEHQALEAFCITVSGSSPHARGALIWPIQTDKRPGIIPACAGSTIGYRRRNIF